jgi:hypothetical protein
VNARAYAASLPSGETAVIILNKDAENDLSLSLDLGGRKIAKVAVEALTAPALDSREAHIAKRATAGRRNNGKIWLDVPHASGIRVVIS